MSEYQYYEFVAIDKPLSEQQQAELRARSTRAEISANSFVNEYNWGDLKGDPKQWMERYFDAHVYLANWGSSTLMLRLPLAALDKRTVQAFVEASEEDESDYGPALEATATAEYWILSFNLSDDSGNDIVDTHSGSQWMRLLLPLRDELLRGDMRPLYLGWLARLGNGEFGDGDLEPPVPAGLQTLTPAQIALTEFIGIDTDYLAAAASVSPSSVANTAHEKWIQTQDTDSLRATLRLLLQGRAQEAERDARTRFQTWERKQPGADAALARGNRRCVAEIEAAGAQAEQIRVERAQAARKAQEAQRQATRAAFLDGLLVRSAAAWAEIEATLQRGLGSAYDQALAAVQDLADAYKQAGKQTEFYREMTRLMATHGKRPAWLARLKKARIVWGTGD